jgi:hypothetical protein
MIADGSTRRPHAANLLMSHAEVAEDLMMLSRLTTRLDSRLQQLLAEIVQLAKDVAVVSNRFFCVPQRPLRETLAT